MDPAFKMFGLLLMSVSVALTGYAIRRAPTGKSSTVNRMPASRSVTAALNASRQRVLRRRQELPSPAAQFRARPTARVRAEA